MKLKRILTALLLAGPLAWAFSAQAGTTTFQGVSVDYGSASANWVDGELVLTYANSSSLAISDGAVKADILAVGGGGGGGCGYSSNYGGSGGGGGKVTEAERLILLNGGELTVTVGTGGSGGASGKAGSKGGDSSVAGSGIESVTAQGGTAGAAGKNGKPSAGTGASGTGTTGVKSEVTGKTYGAGGAAGDGTAPSPQNPNTGNGGKGGKKDGSSSNRKGGDGGNGVVVVRLKEAFASVAVTLKGLILGASEEVSTFTDASTGAAADIAFGNVSSVQFTDEGVVRTERTKDGKLKIVGAGAGTTTATIVLFDNAAKKMTTYTVNVTVNPSIALQDLTIQRGEMVTAFALLESGDAMTFDSVDVKEVLFAKAEIAERGETADGAAGLVGKLAGTTEVTIVKSGQSYVFTVTVEKLLNGRYRAGAYEVAVTNASDVFYVDGDLVIAYRDADGDTAKSFTLPKSTKARLLAIGGGGAGGTYKTPYEKSGEKSGALPGGGGAGRMIEKSDYELAAQRYEVVVGKGGAAATVNTSDAKGGNGGDTTVADLTAKGGGGGGVKSAGSDGGSGGGGSAVSSKSEGNGGSASAVAGMGYGNAGGKSPAGNWHGAGGGGAGGPGGGSNTASATTVSSAWGVGGRGRTNDITGVKIEYARGGAGAWFPPSGLTHTGKPGIDGRGDGGGGGSCSGYSADGKNYVTTLGGRGGNGVVIVRIPAYKMIAEDALVAAFAGQPATVSGTAVALTGDVAGPIRIPDNLGAVTIDLAGHSITGVNGADGDDITAGGDGASALEIVPHEYESVVNAPTVVKVTGSGSLTGGNGGTGHPAGLGAEACAGDASHFNVGSVSCVRGTDGVFIEQHPHEWAYRLENGKIVATCVAPGECSYKTREPFIAVKAEDANYTSMRYDGLNAINGITPATGIVVAPEVYVGRDGTVYPASVTPPTEQGHYSAIMSFDGMSITSDFSIVELPFARTNAYSSAKTAERLGRDVRIALSASFDGAQAINNSDVLFIGSCCQAHSMTAGTIEKTVNALAKYANVRWYAHNGIVEHASEPDSDGYVKMGEDIGRSITLQGGNHCIYTKMMEDLWNELVLNEGRRTYGLIVLEFDGNLLGRIQGEAYQFVFDLPEGWDEDRVAILQAKMKRFYDANKVVWVVPSGNGSDGTATGGCPWTSQPECLWQRAIFNTTEDAGFECPLQHDYENADKLTAYLKRVIVGHFFSKVEMKDKLAEGLSVKTVTPQMRNADGIWSDFERGETEGRYTIYELRSGTTVTADVATVGREVTVSFDMREEQAWACENNVMIGDEFRVVIDAEVDSSFFSDVAPGAEKSTNEGPATFTFIEPNLEGEGGYSIALSNDTPTVKNVKLTPDYASEDVVKIYDGRGTNIVVKPIAPTPDEAVIRYSLDEHGTYADTLELTDVCEKTKVWFEITDRNGEFTSVTNFACVTILPRPEPELESMGLVITPVEAYYNKDPQNISFTVTNAVGEVITPDPEKTKVYYKGPDDADWVPAEEFAGVSNVTKAAGFSDSNGVVTVEVKVSIEGYEDAISSSTVRVMPRVIAEQTGTATKPYDGTPLTCTDHSFDWEMATNYAYEIYHEVKHPEIYDGPPRDDWADAIGFPPGDGLGDVPMTGSQTDVGSSPNTVDLERVTFTGGANKDDYALSFPTGTLTVVAAAIDSKNPAGPAANPGDKPQSADGVTLWAENVVKVYDGVGTNVLPQVYNAVDGNAFAYEYSTNEVDWTSDLAFTNVVNAQKVYFRATPQGTTPNYLPTNGYAYVTITKAVLTVTADDQEIVYGSPAPDASFYTFVYSGFTNGEDRTVLEVEPTFGSAYTTTTPVGMLDITNATPGVARNYEFAYVPGTLTVAKDRGYVGPIADVTYKGTAWEPALTVTNAAGDVLAEGTDYTVAYHDNVHATNLAYAVVTFAGNYDGVATNYFAILPRRMTLVSGTETFTYDGNAHSNIEVTVASGSFVAGEGVATNGFAEVRDVCAGVDNAFAYDFLVGTLAADYEIAVEKGELAVVPAPVVPKNPAGPAANPGDKPASTEPATLWAENVVKVYDGVGTNVLPQVYNAVDGNSFTYEYSLDESTWVSDLAFTNAVNAQKVYFRATPDGANYLPTNGYAFVTITNRPVTVTFAAADKVYDGNADATCTSTNFAGLVAGEDFALDTSAMTFAFDTPDVGSGKTVTASGYDDSLVVSLGETLASNYAFTFIPTTTAAITHAKQTVTSTPYSGTYDGEGHTITVTQEGGTVSYLVDGNWVDAAPLYTNRVEATNVVFRVTKDNYETFEGTNTVTVSAKALTLVSGDKSFVFDGSAHTHHALTGTDGFVVGETFTTNWLCSITDVGTTNNEFAIAFGGTAKAENYALTTNFGTLEVTPAPVGDPSHPGDPASGTGIDFTGEGGSTVPYKGTAWEPEVVCTNLFATLIEGVDYDIAYADNLDATNRATIVITGKGNYTGIFTNHFTITKIPLTVTADAKEIVFGSAAPGTDFYTFAYSGFTNGEDRAVLEAEPTFGSAYTPTTPVGTLPVTNATPGVARNYEFVYVPGTLTVAKDRGHVGPIEDVTYKGTAWEPALTVTNAAGDVLAEGTDYTVAYHDNVHATNLAYAVVTFAGNYGGVVTNCFAILPRPVTLASGSETFTYDGNSHSNVGVTVASGSFVPGEGVATNGFAEVKDVCSGIDNDFGYGFLDGTLAADYEIAVVKGELAVVPAPVDPKKPSGPAANPGDRPKPAEGVTLWAENVVKVYDGVGTNVVPRVYNAVEGNGFAYEYSTNEVDWVSDLAFTNATEGAQKVYFRATPQGTTPNYLPTNGYAYVTITKAVLTVTADDQEIVFGTDAPGASFYTFACSGFTNGEDRSVLEVEPTFGSAYAATTPVGTLDITNATPGVARNYEFAYVPGTLTVLESSPRFTADLEWIYCANRGAYLADLTLTCVNTTDSFGYKPGTMRFLFEDRFEDGLLKLALWDIQNPGRALSVENRTEVANGVTYSSFALADPDPSVANGGWAPNVSKRYAPEANSAGKVLPTVVTPALHVYTLNSPTYGPGKEALVLTNGNTSASAFIGWLAWDWTDAHGVVQTAYLPVAAGKTFAEMMSSARNEPVDAPLSADWMNLRLALGVDFDEPEDVALTISAFKIAGDHVTMSLKTLNEKTGQCGVPNGFAAKVVVLGAVELNGDWEVVAEVQVFSADSFSVLTDGKRFFKALVKPLNVIR